MQRTTASPRLKARLAGLFYFLTGGTGYAFLVRGQLVRFNDAAATVANLAAHERLFRIALVCDVLGVACYVVVTALLYELLKPVNRSVALVAAFLSLMACAIQVSACAFHAGALVVHDGATVLLLLKLHAQGFNIAIVFFGLFCIVTGYLIFRSTFLPRVIGTLLMLAGLAYVFNNLTHFLGFALPAIVTKYVLILPALGEGSLMFWLLFVGLNSQRWDELTAALNTAGPISSNGST